MRKSKFLTFIFAFFPGAGQMYVGLMKKGVSIMTLFFTICAFCMIFPPIAFLLPVLWFYSFFDAINYNSLPYEKKATIEDKIIFEDELIRDGHKFHTKKLGTILGFALIFIGAYSIFDGFVMTIFWDISDYIPALRSVIRNIPSLVLSVIIVFVGLYLVKNRTKDIEDIRDDDYTEFGKDKDNRQL